VVRPLEELQQEIPEHVGHAAGPTLVARRRITLAGQREIAVLLDHFGRPGLQDRIGIIADQLLEVGDAVGPGATCSAPAPAPMPAARTRGDTACGQAGVETADTVITSKRKSRRRLFMLSLPFMDTLSVCRGRRAAVPTADKPDF
jgi:hypothetical protein